jgi:RHS repeat-associated protein
VIKRIDYDSFGYIIDDTDPAFEAPFGFAGGLSDPDTGLVRFGYRDYDPDTGRWTAKDPIFFDGGSIDFYGYVLDNPINTVDPNGLKGGIFIPIRNFIKRNITGGDIIAPIIGKGLSIPTSVVGILTYDYLNPKEAGVASEEFLIYQWEKMHNPEDSNFNIQFPSMLDTISTINDDSEINAEPCEK